MNLLGGAGQGPPGEICSPSGSLLTRPWRPGGGWMPGDAELLPPCGPKRWSPLLTACVLGKLNPPKSSPGNLISSARSWCEGERMRIFVPYLSWLTHTYGWIEHRSWNKDALGLWCMGGNAWQWLGARSVPGLGAENQHLLCSQMQRSCWSQVDLGLWSTYCLFIHPSIQSFEIMYWVPVLSAKLCDLGWVTSPLWTLVSTFVHWTYWHLFFIFIF